MFCKQPFHYRFIVDKSANLPAFWRFDALFLQEMIRFFKSPQPAILIIMPVILLLLWGRIIMDCKPVTDPNSLPLWTGIAEVLSGFPSWINWLLLIGMLTFQAIFFNLIINKHEVLYKSSYLPSFIFTLFISSTPALMSLHPVHLVNLLGLLILSRLFNLFKNESVISPIFDAAFLTGLASLIYIPALMFFPIILIGLWILRPFNFKELLILLTGFVIPFFLSMVWFYWNHSLGKFFGYYSAIFPRQIPWLTISATTATTAVSIFIGLISLLALLKLRANFTKNIVRTRSYQQIFFLFLTFGILSIIITRHPQPIHCAILAFPLALLTAYYYLSAKKRMMLYTLSLWVLIGLIVWNQVSF